MKRIKSNADAIEKLKSLGIEYVKNVKIDIECGRLMTTNSLVGHREVVTRQVPVFKFTHQLGGIIFIHDHWQFVPINRQELKPNQEPKFHRILWDARKFFNVDRREIVSGARLSVNVQNLLNYPPYVQVECKLPGENVDDGTRVEVNFSPIDPVMMKMCYWYCQGGGYGGALLDYFRERVAGLTI
jgi:hypothetical protein